MPPLADSFAGRLLKRFGIVDSDNLRLVEEMATAVDPIAEQAGVLGTKPEYPALSVVSRSRIFPYPRLRITDPATRTSLVFWVQRKGYWNRKRLLTSMFTGKPVVEPPRRERLEQRLRQRAFRLLRMKPWEFAEYRSRQRAARHA